VVRTGGRGALDFTCVVADPPRSLCVRYCIVVVFGLGFGVGMVGGRELYKG
jgi:hypothetical protein